MTMTMTMILSILDLGSTEIVGQRKCDAEKQQSLTDPWNPWIFDDIVCWYLLCLCKKPSAPDSCRLYFLLGLPTAVLLEVATSFRRQRNGSLDDTGWTTFHDWYMDDYCVSHCGNTEYTCSQGLLKLPPKVASSELDRYPRFELIQSLVFF